MFRDVDERVDRCCEACDDRLTLCNEAPDESVREACKAELWWGEEEALEDGVNTGLACRDPPSLSESSDCSPCSSSGPGVTARTSSLSVEGLTCFNAAA